MEWNPFEVENGSKSRKSAPVKDGIESIKSRLHFPTGEERTIPFLSPFFGELIERIKNSLGSIKNYTQISRGKFSDQEFGEYYHRVVTEDIEKMEMVLNGLLDFIKLHTPIKKMNTVHNMIEEVLKRHQVRLEEKGIKLLKRFEKDLPEIIVPDEQLKYILSSVLQYAIILTLSNWNIAISTRTLMVEKEPGEGGGLFKKDGKYVEIAVAFAGHQKPSESGSPTSTIQKEEGPDLLLHFVREIVLHNHGVMKIGADEKKTKTFISLRFPFERRKVVFYPAMN